MKFAARLGYLCTQPSGRCARATPSAKCALAGTASEDYAGRLHLCRFFFFPAVLNMLFDPIISQNDTLQ